MASVVELYDKFTAGFADKAPPAVVDKAKQELADLNEQLAQIDKSLAELPPE